MLQLRAASEALLDSVLWLMSVGASPTLARLISQPDHSISRPQLHRLVEAGYLAKNKAPSGEWVFELTREGSIAAVGGRVPSRQWARSWDQQWRFVLFDIPRGENNARRKLHRWFRKSHFGCIQNSVWISPDPLTGLMEQIELLKAGPDSILHIEGISLPDTKDQHRQLARKAWDFDEINRRYEAYLETAKHASRSRRADAREQAEHRAWVRAAKFDPMLPDELLPRGYLGRKAWARREELLRRSGIDL